MSDEKVKSSALELEEKVAVGAVFLLAGWFLWQFLGSNEGTVPFRNEPELLEEDASRVRLFPDDNALPLEQDVNAEMRTEPVIVAEQSAVTVQPITEPVIPAQKRWINRSEVAAPSVGVPTQTDTVPLTAKPVTPVVETAKKPVVSGKVPPSPTLAPTWPDVVPHTAKPVKPIVETVKPAIVTKSISTSAAPTIQPVTSDLSQGLLRLSGTGKPGGHLQLLLNGRKASNIPVNTEGNWHYESNLKPGEYSVQVLSMELDEHMGVQSALAQVTIPKPQQPIVEVIVDQPKTGEDLKPVEAVVNPAVTPDVIIDKTVSSDSGQKLNDRFYEVKYGDTLNKLARRFRVSLRSLVRANKVSDKDQIEVGQMLIIPGRYPGRKK